MNKSYKKMKEGGKVISDADRKKMDQLIAKIESGRYMSDADRLAKMARVKNPRESGKVISDRDLSLAGDVTTGLGRSDADREMIARGGVKKMKYGGKVEKMMDGGVAGGSCRGGGAALRGTKFQGVK